MLERSQTVHIAPRQGLMFRSSLHLFQTECLSYFLDDAVRLCSQVSKDNDKNMGVVMVVLVVMLLVVVRKKANDDIHLLVSGFCQEDPISPHRLPPARSVTSDPSCRFPPPKSSRLLLCCPCWLLSLSSLTAYWTNVNGLGILSSFVGEKQTMLLS